MAIVTRSGKGSPLTIDEMDGNFTYLEGLSGGVSNKRELIFELLTSVNFNEPTLSLIVGRKYLVELVVGDDFSNVGYVSDYVPFTATNTTPTTWVNNSYVIELPNTIDYKIYKNDFENLDFIIAIDMINLYPFIYITFSNFTIKHIESSSFNFDDGYYKIINNSNRLVSFVAYDDNAITATSSTDYL